MRIDRAGLAEFLRRRRESLQPEDVGLPRGPRRRTGGLRREEVAALCHMSTDYYARLEQERGPQPSEQMIASIAQGLHLSLDERDHLFRLAGHQPPPRGASTEHISPGLLRIFDRLGDTPAEIRSEEHTSELQSRQYLVCRLLLEKKKQLIIHNEDGQVHVIPHVSPLDDHCLIGKQPNQLFIHETPYPDHLSTDIPV